MKPIFLFITLFLIILSQGCLEEENSYINMIYDIDCRPVTQLSAEEKYKFVESVYSGDSTFCLSREILTEEGDPVFQYLVIKPGKMFLVTDSREDKFFGEGEPITKTDLIDIRIGYWDIDKAEFYPEESPVSSEQNLLEHVIVYSFNEGRYHPFN